MRTNHEWIDQAVCALPGAPSMYPSDMDRDGKTAAKLVCFICPVKSECLAEALRNCETHGIWGGKTYDERVALKRNASRRKNRLSKADQKALDGVA